MSTRHTHFIFYENEKIIYYKDVMSVSNKIRWHKNVQNERLTSLLQVLIQFKQKAGKHESKN
jgi:hypothetical protein